MAKKEVPQLIQHWLILELSEYFTLRNRGLLHTIPASRYVDINATYRDWYRALPPNWDNGRYFVVRAIRPISADVALRFQDVDGTTFYAFKSEDTRNSKASQATLEFLRSRLGSAVTGATPFADTITRIRYAQDKYPNGLALVSLADYEALRSLGAVRAFLPANAGLPADLCLDLDAWRRQLPDFEDENQVLVLKLTQPVSANMAIPREALQLSPVYPLTERGDEILRIEKSDIALEPAVFEKTFVRPILRERLSAEIRYNAQKLAALVSSKPSKEVLALGQQLEKAWELRTSRPPSASPNPGCRSFWDYLLDYDRTGEKAMTIPNTDQGYLQDLLQVIGRYLKYTHLIPRRIEEEDFKRVVQSWSTLANDPQVSVNPTKIFTPKASKQQLEAVRKVSEHLEETAVQPLLAGFIFLRLRRELGDLEQSLTRKKVQEYEQVFSKNKGEMYVAFYAIGLMFPFKNFAALYEEYVVQPFVAPTTQEPTGGPSLFSQVTHTDVATASTGSPADDNSTHTHSWGEGDVKPASSFS